MEIPCSKDFKGFSFSSVRVSLGEQKSLIEKADCEQISFYLQSAGVVNAQDGKVFIQIEPGDENIMCALLSFRLVKKLEKSSQEKSEVEKSLIQDKVVIIPQESTSKPNTFELPSDERLQRLKDLGYFSGLLVYINK